MNNIFKMMVNPRGFVSHVPKKDIGKIPLYLAWVIGMVFLFEKASSNQLNKIYSLPTILIVTIIIAIPIGFILVYLLAFFLKITGKFFSGKASYKELITACIYGRVPEIFILVTWALLLIYFGDAAFSSTKITASPALYITILLLLQLIFFVWEIVASLQGVAQMQKFSAWMSLWSYIIAFVMVLIVSYFIEYFTILVFSLNTQAVESLTS